MEVVYMDFDDEDNPVITVKGMAGKGCKDLTAGLENKLGKVTKDEKTDEYFEVNRGSDARVHNRR